MNVSHFQLQCIDNTGALSPRSKGDAQGSTPLMRSTKDNGSGLSAIGDDVP